MKNRFLIFTLTLIISCSSIDKNRALTNEIRKEIKNNNITSSIDIASKEEFYKENNSKLLKNLELATLHYLNKNYYQSLKYFEIAKQISDELWTTRISKKLTNLLVSVSDDYDGEIYEKSMIRFYLSLVNFNLYKQGFYEEYIDLKGNKIEKKELSENERRFHLNYARSTIMEWDSFLKSTTLDESGKAIYKNDMLAKLFGSIVHKEFDTLGDRQISLKLQEEAEQLLLKNYNLYGIYNEKNDKFIKDFSKLPNKTLQELYKNYIKETIYAKSLKDYIVKNKNNLKRNKFDNVIILLKDNLISEKDVDIINVPIGNIPDELKALSVAIYGSTVPTMKIEFPKINTNIVVNNFTARLFKNNTLKAESQLSLAEPLSDIAIRTMDDKIISLKASVIAKTTIKYIAALTASLALYSSDNDLMKLSAIATYYSSIKLIENTSKADIRYWSSLFSNAYLSGFIVENGDYKLNIYKNENLIYTKDIKVENNKTNFIDINIF